MTAVIQIYNNSLAYLAKTLMLWQRTCISWVGNIKVKNSHTIYSPS